MKLNLSIFEIKHQFPAIEIIGNTKFIIDVILFDSRKIAENKNVSFVALKGDFNDGHNFVYDSYKKGVRCFIISQHLESYQKDATYVVVDDSLNFIQKLARFHRDKFNIPIIGITGSLGKTTVKEWIYHLLKKDFRIVRSPKSYNSQLGVALSLFEINHEADLAIIEAAISKPGEMEKLQAMIKPTFGVLTNLSQRNNSNFLSFEHLTKEHLLLFKNVGRTYIGVHGLIGRECLKEIHGIEVFIDQDQIDAISFQDESSVSSAKSSICVANEFTKISKEAIHSLPRLANRMESFEGINNLTIINDCYNFDLDGIKLSIEYALSISKHRKLLLLIGELPDYLNKEKLSKTLSKFKKMELIFWDEIQNKLPEFHDATLLIKGYNTHSLQKWLNSLKNKTHKTCIEYNLSALRKNLGLFKDLLLPKTKILCMVKAQSYGSGLEKIGLFLEKSGVDMLGVAYSDEGVELRKVGVKLPILVMNPNSDSFDVCIEFGLTPAIYNIDDLDILITELLKRKIQSFPIHLKLETGMNRLGITEVNLKEIIEMVQAQPEVYISGVYSHLADADNFQDPTYSLKQFIRFEKLNRVLDNNFSIETIKHILNTEGILNFPDFQYDMVRIGIGMFGITENVKYKEKLHPVIEWKSEISQIKSLEKGESVGYGKSYTIEKGSRLGIVPVGYADGFRRNLGNGKGGVYVHGIFCKTVGRVCMDMIMIDLTLVKHVKKGDLVEIIGPNQTIEKFAKDMDTIPYEVLTSFSKRVPRVYIEN